MNRILSLAVSIIVVSLMTTATHAQTDSLKLRFHVPFPFTVENATFAAGEYEITQPARSGPRAAQPAEPGSGLRAC